VSAICGIVRAGLDDYLSDTLPAPQRRILRDHLAACAVCREAATGRDASLAFSRRFDESVPAEEVADVLAAVRTGVAHIEAERRLRRPGRGRRGAAAAAAIALAALLAPAVSSRRETGAVAASNGAGVRVTAPAMRAAAETGIEPATASAEAGAPASSATVYELNPGAGREEPRVVWIVDRGLDI
jgi:anti-sigma factor RsiW